jgi:hypothetical protein
VAIGLTCCAVCLAGGVLLLNVRAGGSERRPAVEPPAAEESLSLSERTYRRLDEVRRVRREQLSDYLDRLQALARSVSDDEILRECFEVWLRFRDARREQPPPEQARRAMADFDEKTVRYWLENYAAFYGILFVDPAGEVFYALGRKSYIGENIFHQELQGHLARRLEENPERAFVDFAVSNVSGEPTACFVQPLREHGEYRGCFVLQCSIRKINDIFARHRNMGHTGEAFLVNEDCRMLTESRFRRDSTILQQRLAAENIRSKFAEVRGHKVVTDYRGMRALTSFEVCPVMDVNWLLVAKIDEAEVLTEHYRKNRQALRPELLDAARRRCPAVTSPREPDEDAEVVEMDEFRIARPGEQILTYGVSTCTAVMIYLPGEFACLAHASVYDRMYGGTDLDLLSRMIQQVCTYEICPYRKRELRVLIVAPHTRSIRRAVDTLVDSGIFLSQIRFACDESARSATVWHDVDAGRTSVRWEMLGASLPPRFQRAEDLRSLGEILRGQVRM